MLSDFINLDFGADVMDTSRKVNMVKMLIILIDMWGLRLDFSVPAVGWRTNGQPKRDKVGTSPVGNLIGDNHLSCLLQGFGNSLP